MEIMNPTEQRNHRKATTEIAHAVEALSEATQDELTRIETELRESISAERTHRLKLANEQRAYVDAEDRKGREIYQERWNADSESHQNILKRLSEFRDRTFMGRMRWIFRGF